MASFKSIFQGDHAGVEIATSAHEGLLKSAGLLTEDTRIVSSRPFAGDDLCQGLVIDDYFAIARVPVGATDANAATECLARSKALYKKHAILGSDDKDITGASKAKIIGASVDSSEQCRSRGHVLVAAPAEKRMSLSWVTLQVCQLNHTSDSLHLCILGGWTSIMMFRRPFMSILQKSFALVDVNQFDAADPKLVGLSRPVANELTLVSILSPLCVSDIAVDFCDRLFATDASLQKGAIVSSPIDREIMQVLWRSCRSKGGYSKLLSKEQSVLARCLDFEEEEPQKPETIKRPLAYKFDFVEVFAGAATVTRQMADRGFSVCNPIDISFDAELDVSLVHVFEWLLHLVVNHLVESLMIEPPCTTHSIMRRPALRSRAVPFGFNPKDPQTRMGTLLAYRAFQLLYACLVYGVTGVLENPWPTLMKFLPGWSILLAQVGCSLVRCDSCSYGSVHLKAFAFLCAWADVEPISGRCSGDHIHVPIEGSLTKKSATYVDGLSKALAEVMIRGIRRLRAEYDAEGPKPSGLESQLINELCLSLKWSLDAVWTFRISAHINVLELSSVMKLVSRLVKEGKALRVVILVDSNVIRCAASKGRSSSRALSRFLVRLAALAIAGGLYLVFGFVPTRLNIADDPTRDVVLREPIPGLDLATWDRADLFRLASFPRFKRAFSNWVRLVLRICGPCALSFTDRSLFRAPRYMAKSVCCGDVPKVSLSDFHGLDFDATLGYPGEGPPLGFVGNCAPLRVVVVVLIFQPWLTAAVLAPRNSGDLLRQQQRSLRPPLQEGRPVLSVTTQQRSSFITLFEAWLGSLGHSLEFLLENHFTQIDLLNKLLVQFGRALYASGRPYNHYAETINAIAARKPVVRRQLQEAWNLAYSWVREEPSIHHVAMPWQILLSAISVCLVWGWVDVAGMFALTWGSLLRVGEFLQATRRDLLLPVDTNYTNQFALLALKEPKTRFTAARHQSAKLDVPDLLRVVHVAFSRLRPSQKLWPKSGQTLRLRFKQVMSELGLKPDITLNGKTLDLGSLRPGGATWMIQQTENGEFVRRRGRWISQKVMEIYLQEISSFQFLAILPPAAQQKIFALCEFFLTALHGAEEFWNANIPASVWFLIWNGPVTRR